MSLSDEDDTLSGFIDNTESDTEAAASQKILPLEVNGLPEQRANLLRWRVDMSTSVKIFVQFLASGCIDASFFASIHRNIQGDHECGTRLSLLDTYFAPALQHIDELLNDRKRFVVASTAWTADFLSDLHAYPRLHTQSAHASEEKECEACQRSGRKVSIEFTLSGDQVDQQKLSVIMTRAEDFEYPTWSLGRFCAQRATLYHELHHFKWSQYLRMKGEVARRMRRIDDTSDLPAVLDKLLDDGHIVNMVCASTHPPLTELQIQRKLDNLFLNCSDYTR